MLDPFSNVILASAETGVLGVVIAAFFVMALAAKIGTAVFRIFFGLIKIGIGLVVLAIVLGIATLFVMIGH